VSFLICFDHSKAANRALGRGDFPQDLLVKTKAAMAVRHELGSKLTTSVAKSVMLGLVVGDCQSKGNL